MNSYTVTKLMKRFKKDDLHIVAENWSVIRTKLRLSPDGLVQELNGTSGKKKFIYAVLKALRKRTISNQDVAELDLLCITTYPKTKNWLVFKLQHLPGKSRTISSSPHVSSPLQFRKQLQKQLDTFEFKNVVSVNVKDEALWAYINIANDKQKVFSVAGAMYVVHYPGTDYLCIANLKATRRANLFQALTSVLKCTSLEQLDLEGHCVKSLLNIVLNRNGQELPQSLQLEKFLAPPKTNTPEQDPESIDDRIHQENTKEKQKCKEFVANRFGDGPQPILENVTYTLETKFHGGNHVPAEMNNTIVRCKVKFSGPNVLEGIKNLATAGLVTIPMKDHLSRVKTLAKNKFRFVPRHHQSKT